MKSDIAVWISLGGLLSGSVCALPLESGFNARDTSLPPLDSEHLATRETIPSSTMTENKRLPRSEIVDPTVEARGVDVTVFSDETAEPLEKRNPDNGGNAVYYCNIM
ncbi:hypothetical protein MMC07_000219 [Pseudocyphellaria aurata]|nr:hypothetical protein [Pseudocyphellaria aurata]